MTKVSCGWRLAAIAAVTFSAAFLRVPQARADNLPLGDASNYAVLYEGTGGHNLQITNVTVNGNIGVGGTGAVQYNGPGTINGELDFSAANTGQYSNNNPGSNVGPTSVNYNVAAVTSALNTVNSLSSSFVGQAGTNLAISGTQTINASAGTLDTINGVNYLVFNITSYSENNGNVVTINGATNGDVVVFNFGLNSNVNLGGDVTLNGLTDDQVLWNFDSSSSENVSLNNNASSYPLPLAFQGDILAPDDCLSSTNANLDGRLLGGDSCDMQIVSGSTITASTAMPEGSSSAVTLLMVLVCLVGCSAFKSVVRPS